MPGSTPIFGFPYPDPSDLVANYPALGQQLAEDVEDEIIASGGFSFITASTFTTQSSVSVNNCFSATYENYRALIRVDPTNNVAIEMRLRAAGSDISTGSYNWSRAGHNYANTTNDSGAASVTLWQFNTTSTGTLENVSSIDFHAPFETKNTGFTSNFASENMAGVYNGMFYNTASADGFTILVSGGTITGNLRVYGYKNS
jgi:hypothetical protein